MNPCGDLSFMSADSAMMIKDMCQAVTITVNWENLKQFVPGDGGFTFGDLPAWFADIDKAMEYKGHSGGSYGWTMSLVHYIARYGWQNFLAKLTSTDQETKNRLRRMELPDIIEQAKSVARAWRTRMNNSTHTDPVIIANLKDRVRESEFEVMARVSELIRLGK